MIRSFGISIKGPIRPNNEDYFFADDELGLFVVADGMGGHAAGEVASRIAVEAIARYVRSSAAGAVNAAIDGSQVLSDAGRRLQDAISVANREVFSTAEEHDAYSGMGTTVVCALVHDDVVTIGHVGDSRLYLLSGGALSVQTRDDTWAEMLRAGAGVSAHCLAQHPMRNVLTNVLGAREHVDVHLTERRIRHGDLVLLCSDGVHGVLDDESLEQLLAVGSTVERLARAIVAAALDRGSRDNVTVVAIRYSADDNAT